MYLEAQKGDIIKFDNGEQYIISQIMYQDYWDRPDCGWMIEFIDSKGKYHYWKQADDGGEIILNPELKNPEGVSCKDIFEKYGYKV